VFLDVEGPWRLEFRSSSDTIGANLYCHLGTHGHNRVAHGVQHQLHAMHLSPCDVLFPKMDFFGSQRQNVHTGQKCVGEVMEQWFRLAA